MHHLRGTGTIPKGASELKPQLTVVDILSAGKNEEHLWVKITVTMVKVTPSKDQPATFIVDSSEEAVNQAEEDAVFGCYFCDVMLREGYGTKCPGPPPPTPSTPT